MDLLGIKFNDFSWNINISCFCHMHLLDFGFSALGKMLKLGHQPTFTTFNTLIKCLCIEGKVTQALPLFHHMVCQGYGADVNTMINVVCKTGDTNLAPKLMRNMEEVAQSYSRGFGVVKRYERENRVKKAREILDLNACQLDVYTYSIMICGYFGIRTINDAMKLFNDMIRIKFTYNILIDGMSRMGKLEAAKKLILKLTANA